MDRRLLSSEDIRKKTIRLSCESGAGHLAPSLSSIEILTVLFRDFMKFKDYDPFWEGRDRLVFSKGHGAYAYYIILNEIGFLPDFELKEFYKTSSIKGCLVSNPNYMIEASTGSLGHGLPIAVGMAKSLKMQNLSNKVIAIVGDGEMQEGSNFEALQLAYRFKLDNLLLIIDANDLQAMDRVENVGLPNDKLSKILSLFTVKNCFYDIDGHNEELLGNCFSNVFLGKGRKGFINIAFCRTVKGKGLDFMENVAKYHFRCPTEDGYKLNNDANK
ncbi:MAG: transketolase [Candidatus Acidulodesulfobacterium ferriphilum]|jgi:transketolase|uniref:Transketolase n=1 Tax=Candidatus Acidulodesulfobacterium ferriphilum TaxID=2597223 RepID=A0A519BAE8_9DELT|nr:MAG: transketolase [Candidatus Acidulodesulfobacterium ferriphilum]